MRRMTMLLEDAAHAPARGPAGKEALGAGEVKAFVDNAARHWAEILRGAANGRWDCKEPGSASRRVGAHPEGVDAS